MRAVALVQFGVGSVGRALIEMILDVQAYLAQQGIAFEYVALADRNGAIIAEPGGAAPGGAPVAPSVPVQGRGWALS
ncbi:MAG: hypothetical protein Q9O62_00305 [Ardenticatenia bacterium]|nr:hypothetical protein [Ardenticatenia bacterium]